LFIPDSGSWFFTHPRSRGDKGTGSRIRIRNIAYKQPILVIRKWALLLCSDISESESPGLELLLVRLCAVLPELTYRSLRDILVSLTLLHAAAAHHLQLATLDCLLDQELADKMAAHLDLSATQGGGGPHRCDLWCSEFRDLTYLVRIRIRESVPLTNGSGSDSFLQWL
jgi:hypothetical protein